MGILIVGRSVPGADEPQYKATLLSLCDERQAEQGKPSRLD